MKKRQKKTLHDKEKQKKKTKLGLETKGNRVSHTIFSALGGV